MADFNKPTVDSDYLDFPQELRDTTNAAIAFLDDGQTHTNIPRNAKRWNATTKIFERFNGSQWEPMAEVYHLPVDYNAIKNKPQISSEVNNESTEDLASAAAVKLAYDNGVEAKAAADNAQQSADIAQASAATAQRTAEAKQSPASTLSGYGIADFKVEIAPTNADANDYRTDGHYYFASGQNLPDSNSWHILVMSDGSSRCIHQIAKKAGSQETRERYSISDSQWSSWAQTNFTAAEAQAFFNLISAKTTELESSVNALEVSINALNTLKNEFSYHEIGNFKIHKFPDGTMIQHCVHTPPRFKLGKPTFPGFDWAVSFIEKPALFGRVIKFTGNHEAFPVIEINEQLTTNSRVWYLVKGLKSKIDQEPTSCITAIGRWK